MDSDGNVRVAVSDNVYWERTDGTGGQWGGDVVAIGGNFYLAGGTADAAQGTDAIVVTGSPAFSGETDRSASNRSRLERYWRVRGASNGIVVQEVNSTIVHLNGRVVTNHFWEAWELRNGQWQAPGLNRDRFGVVRGQVQSMTVNAIAFFYAGVRMPNSMVIGGHRDAGELYSSTTRPNLPAPSAGPVPVHWRCEPC